MQQPLEFFGETELALIFIAKRLNEALKVEELLTSAGLDYLVEPDRYRGGLIFQTERIGAFFYVLPEIEDQARALLAETGFRPHAPTGS